VIRSRLAIALLPSIFVLPAGAAEWLSRQPAGPYVIELKVSPREKVSETPMIFTVVDAAGKPVDTAAARGHADFSSGGLKGRATLHPDGANRMKGYGLMSAQPDLRIEVTIAFPGEPPQRAAFVPAGNARPDGPLKSPYP
jgi:hypothetical protein